MHRPSCLITLLILAIFAALGQAAAVDISMSRWPWIFHGESQATLSTGGVANLGHSGDFDPDSPVFLAWRKKRYAEQAAAFKEWRSRQPPRPPPPRSLRWPGHSKLFNRADMIEQQINLCNQSTWGFIVYRTAYKSDADWLNFIVRWNATLEHEFESHNGLDVLERMNQTVMQDRERFDGATTHEVREHFRAWIAENEPAQTEDRLCRSDPYNYWSTYPSRYSFIVSVDEESLESIIHDQALILGKSPHVVFTDNRQDTSTSSPCTKNSTTMRQ